ncbi:flagellar biosynthetic protein FliO [Colwelliaceae bacterium 6441]
MIKLLTFIFTIATATVYSVNAFAQEEVIEVGKHANPNLDALSMIMSLLMVLVLIVISAWVLRKFNVVNKSVAGMKVITTLPLGTKEKLVVVEVADEQLLLGVSAQQISLIKILDKPLELDAPMSAELGQSLTRLFSKAESGSRHFSDKKPSSNNQS